MTADNGSFDNKTMLYISFIHSVGKVSKLQTFVLCFYCIGFFNVSLYLLIVFIY